MKAVVYTKYGPPDVLKLCDVVSAETGAALGTYAEYCCLREDGALALKPVNLSYAETVAVCAGGLTALTFLRDAGKVASDQHVVINGASGSIGTSAVQLEHAFAANVVGVCSTANVELVRSLGVGRVVNYTRDDFTNTGDAYDLVFDTVGKSSFGSCKRVLKPNGMYLSTVLTAGILFRMLSTSLFGRKKAKMTFAGLRPPVAKAEDLRFLKELAEAETVKPVIDRVYPFEDVVEAHRYVDGGHKKGNVVLAMR